MKTNSKFDRCVLCNRGTKYTKKVHIDYRRCYVEGVGQLCEECYVKVYENGSKK